MPAGSKPKPGPFTCEIAAILRAHMARKFVSQTTLAQMINLSSSQLSKMLRGDRNIDLDQLDALCWHLQLCLANVIAEAEAETESRFLSWKPSLLSTPENTTKKQPREQETGTGK